jgi:hypothetical protein
MRLRRRVAVAAGVVLPLLGAVAVQRPVVVLVAAVVAVVLAVGLGRAVIGAAPGGRRVGAVAEDAEIVLGVLEIGLGRHTIPRRGRIARQAQIFLEDLPGIAADPSVGTVAVEGAGAGLAAAPTSTAAATAATVLLTIGSAARPTPIVGTLSHRSLASEMDDLPLAPSEIAHSAISRALNHTQVNFGW